jgi:hypothetical protein
MKSASYEKGNKSVRHVEVSCAYKDRTCIGIMCLQGPYMYGSMCLQGPYMYRYHVFTRTVHA